MTDNIFDLDTITAKADADYAGTQIRLGDEVLTLRNFLQLSRSERGEVQAAQSEMSGDDVDQADALGKILTLVADNKELAHKLLERLDGNLAHLMGVFKTYNEGTQAGEA